MISSSEVGQLATFSIQSMEAFVWISRGLWVEFQGYFEPNMNVLPAS